MKDLEDEYKSLQAQIDKINSILIAFESVTSDLLGSSIDQADKESFLQVKHNLYKNRDRIEEKANKILKKVAKLNKNEQIC